MQHAESEMPLSNPSEGPEEAGKPDVWHSGDRSPHEGT